MKEAILTPLSEPENKEQKRGLQSRIQKCRCGGVMILASPPLQHAPFSQNSEALTVNLTPSLVALLNVPEISFTSQDQVSERLTD